MKIRFALAGLILAAPWCLAQTPPAAVTGLHVVTNVQVFSFTNVIVPLDRIPPLAAGGSAPWSTVGIAGGIPNYTYCNSVTNFGAVGDGVTECYTAFANAISACTNGGYVYVPPGTYKVSSSIVIANPKRIELRGAGAFGTGISKIVSYASSGTAAIDITSGGVGASSTAVVSGGTRGSTSVVVASASGLSVGVPAHFKQNYDIGITPNTGNGPEDTSYSVINQWVLITNISGTTIQFTPPLYSDLRSSLSPVLEHYGTPMTTLCGVRGLFIDCEGTVNNGVRMFNFYQTWLKDCVVSNSPLESVPCIYGCNAQIEGNTITHHQSYGNSERYQIQFANFCGNSLAQDNIVQAGNLCISVQYGASGNVIAYNYSDQAYIAGNDTSTSDQGIGICTHGTGSSWNLFEGNVVNVIKSDNYWGCNLTNTYFRNWCTQRAFVGDSGVLSAGTTYPGWELDPGQPGMSFVGNILSRFAAPSAGIYSIDSGSATTLFMHGNFDFVSGTTQWSNGVSTTLPNSYYLSSLPKPAWFKSLPWPAIGPDVNTTTSITSAPVIPAQARWLGVSY